MKDRFRIKWLLLSNLILLISLVGITYAWFARQNASMSTLFSIEKPDAIVISNLNGSDMTELNLDYIEGVDRKDKDGTIHIFRPICIKSTSSSHQLEIAHTTNLKSLTFNIYPWIDGTVSEPVFSKEPLQGSYKNKEGDLSARKELLENYQSGDTIDTYAYPLYWIAQVSSTLEKEEYCQVKSEQKTEFDISTMQNRTFYYTYYNLEISWKETQKETDLFYIMATNIDEVGIGE